MNILLLIIGCFLEVVSTLLLVMPILAPVLVPLGVDPVHFGIIFTHNMEVGLVHPPVGLNLFVLSTISDAPIGEVIRGILPFLVILLLRAGADHLLAGDDAVAAGSGVREVGVTNGSGATEVCCEPAEALAPPEFPPIRVIPGAEKSDSRPIRPAWHLCHGRPWAGSRWGSVTAATVPGGAADASGRSRTTYSNQVIPGAEKNDPPEA